MVGERELKRQIQDVFAELGSCRIEVAEALRNSGVHAVPKDPQDCAVAVYLKAILGADPRVVSVLVHRRRIKVLVDEPKWYRLSHLVTVCSAATSTGFHRGL
jgi:hypothetical protein